ncbi:diguanylate cyclase [Vibrio palustris]|uniref:diguanylate cyclase n=1 Tax=Vibrio palustris TaxID=1918946 RepID=A0A1R4B7B2_9VIBR|nr:diguanylate cyclase [Vibrio palustris]SJL84761.1 putative diguanylate cyclase YdaM [Vibrio palustris]
MKRLSQTLSKGVLIWIICSLIPIGYYLYQTNKVSQFIVEQLESQGFQFLSFVETQAHNTAARLQQSVDQLSHSSLLNQYAKNEQSTLKEYIENQWYITSFTSQLFYQLRYIDIHGNERIRVNYDLEKPFPEIVPDSELQNKSTRDYFRYATTLKPNEQGEFGIDIEYENHKPVIPYKPGLRIIVPINSDTQRFGYFVANLNVLPIIKKMTDNNQELTVDFVDRNGFYIISSNPNKLFGDLISERSQFNIPTEYPMLWKTISQHPNKKNVVLTSKGLFFYQPFVNTVFANSGPLIMISHFPAARLKQILSSRDSMILSQSVIIWLVLGLISILGSLVWNHLQVSKQSKMFAKFIMENGMAAVITNKNHDIIQCNHKFSKLFLIDPKHLMGKNLLHFITESQDLEQVIFALDTNNEWSGDLALLSPNGEQLVCQTSIQAHMDKRQKRVENYIYSFADVSNHHQVIESLTDKNHRDPMTSLWNKAKFEDILEIMARHQPTQVDNDIISNYLAIIDIDSFKTLNDTHGHRVGDEVIMYIALQLTSLLRQSDFIARIGGDEFAVIIQSESIDTVCHMMNRVRVSIASWPEYNASISIGIATISEDPIISFTHADQALYRAKRKGRNCISTHNDNISPT